MIFQEDYFAYCIVAIFLILIISVYIYRIPSVGNNTNSSSVYLYCPRGSCPTNILNGEKRCPADTTDSIVYDPRFEVCNTPFGCNNPITSFALKQDGSTNALGACPVGDTCRCLQNATCPSQAVVMFQMDGGNIYMNSNQTSQVVFNQTGLDYQDQAGVVPLVLTDVNTQFCAIKAYNLNRLGQGACMFADTPTVKDIADCLHLNPCIIGVLAFQPTNASTFVLNQNNTDAIFSIPVACVPGARINPLCTGTNIPVWDNVSNTIICSDTA